MSPTLAVVTSGSILWSSLPTLTVYVFDALLDVAVAEVERVVDAVVDWPYTKPTAESSAKLRYLRFTIMIDCRSVALRIVMDL